MSARQYTAEEQLALRAGLTHPEFMAVAARLEREVKELCAGMPLAAIGAAIHGLICGNQPLRDFLDTVDATCERERNVIDTTVER